MGSSVEEQAAVLALPRVTTAVIYENRSALDLLRGRIGFMAEEHRVYAAGLASRVDPNQVSRCVKLIECMTDAGLRIFTVLDEAYTVNLQSVYNRPPFLWVRGSLQPEDFKAVAVVGTRDASEGGKKRAHRLARELAGNGVTVLSGLARGIDTAAHTGALVVGGRTVAVVGQGLRTPLYPKDSRELGERIAKDGVLVSQFWPDEPPHPKHFPMRNVVMSGMAMGTVVVGATSVSGAKMQARLALEHGKRLFLLDLLVKSQQWAQRYAERPGMTVVRKLDDIIEVPASLLDAPKQLELQL